MHLVCSERLSGGDAEVTRSWRSTLAVFSFFLSIAFAPQKDIYVVFIWLKWTFKYQELTVFATEFIICDNPESWEKSQKLFFANF